MRHKDWYDNGVRYVVLFYRAEQFAGSLQSSAAVAGAADSSARCGRRPERGCRPGALDRSIRFERGTNIFSVFSATH